MPTFADLLPLLPVTSSDGAHDQTHVRRVWRNAQAIAAGEPPCDMELLAAAVALHDCIAVEKNSPDRPLASQLAAAHARTLVAPLAWPAPRVDALAHAIAAHSFTANIPPETVEAKILQDADRLDAIGAIGIARCFYTAGRMNSALYHPDDPHAARRALNDNAFALDHFPVKLLTLAAGFQTRTGQTLAEERQARMLRFLGELSAEI